MTLRFGERRRAPRVSSAIDGLVAIEGLNFAIDCRVLDVNQYGARIYVGERRVPDTFFLIDVLGSLAYRAEVRWRERGEVGLRFHEAHQLIRADAPEWLRQFRTARLAQDAHERSDALTSEIPDAPFPAEAQS